MVSTVDTRIRDLRNELKLRKAAAKGRFTDARLHLAYSGQNDTTGNLRAVLNRIRSDLKSGGEQKQR